MLLGLVVGLGTSKLISLTFSLVLGFAILRYRSRLRIPFILWVLIASIGVGAIWSVDPGKPIYMCCTIVVAYIAYRALPRDYFKVGIYLVVAVQLGVLGYQYWTGDVSRPNGFSRNASVLGLSGMWALPLLPMAVVGGLSGSRTAVIGALILGTRSRRAMISSVIMIVAFLAVTLTFYPERISIEGLRESSVLRVAAIEGELIEANPTDTPVEVSEIEWRWYGYGFGQYYLATGHVQPHNIFVKAWYEFGLLTIPVGYALVYLWASMNNTGRFRKHDWWFLVAACATGMLTDELIGSFEGVYMILGYVIIRESAQQVVKRPVSADSYAPGNAAILEHQSVGEFDDGYGNKVEG